MLCRQTWLFGIKTKELGMESISEDRTSSRVSTWEETAAGLLPVIVLSLAITLEGTSTSGFSGVIIYPFILLILALQAVGIPLALERGLPRWSSSYLGLAVLDIFSPTRHSVHPILRQYLGDVLPAGSNCFTAGVCCLPDSGAPAQKARPDGTLGGS
jgi:hypothetical protein